MEDTDMLKDGIKTILKGKNQNDMSNIRAMFILNTTNDADMLENKIRDSVSALHEYCEKFHTELEEQHKCTIEIHKGPKVPAIHTSMRGQGYLADSQQKVFEPHAKQQSELDVSYSKHIRGSTTMRKSGEHKELDDATFKEWLAKYKTKDGAPGIKSNTHELY